MHTIIISCSTDSMLRHTAQWLDASFRLPVLYHVGCRRQPPPTNQITMHPPKSLASHLKSTLATTPNLMKLFSAHFNDSSHTSRDAQTHRIWHLLWKKIKRYTHLKTISQVVVGYLHSIHTIVAFLVVIVTLINTPTTLYRVHALVTSRKLARKHHEIFTSRRSLSNEGGSGFLKMPYELQLRIAGFLDTRGILDLALTCKQLAVLALDEQMWACRLAQEWPRSDMKLCLQSFRNRKRKSDIVGSTREECVVGKLDDELVNRPAYSLFKMRWSALGNPHKPQEKQDVLISQIMKSEMTDALGKLVHFVLIPLKIAGLATYPVYYLVKTKHTRASTPSLACLRCISLLTQFSSKTLAGQLKRA